MCGQMEMPDTERSLFGAGLIVVASAFFATSGLLIQLSSKEVSSWTTVFAGFLVGGLFVIPFVLVRRGASAFASPNVLMLIARGGVAVAQIGVLFKAIASISLLEAMLFRETAPLWVPIFSLLFLGESMPRRIWPTLLCGFTGVALVLHPNLTALNTGYLFGLAAGILFAVQIMLTRRLNQLHEPQDRILLYIYLIGIVGTIIPAAQTYVRPDFVTVERLTFAGLFLLGSTTFIVKAMGHAPAWLLAPLGYSAVVFSALLDWLVLDKLPGMVSSAGIMLVIVSGISTMRFAPHQGHGETAMIAKEGCT